MVTKPHWLKGEGLQAEDIDLIKYRGENPAVAALGFVGLIGGGVYLQYDGWPGKVLPAQEAMDLLRSLVRQPPNRLTVVSTMGRLRLKVRLPMEASLSEVIPDKDPGIHTWIGPRTTLVRYAKMRARCSGGRLGRGVLVVGTPTEQRVWLKSWQGAVEALEKLHPPGLTQTRGRARVEL